MRTVRHNFKPFAMRKPGELRAFDPALYAGGRRQAEHAAHRAGAWLRAAVFGDERARNWCRENGMQRALTGIGPGQSAIVPDELVGPIIRLRESYGVVRRLCRRHPMASGTATIPHDTGDTPAWFVGREAPPSPSDPTLDAITLTALNLAAETRISNDYAQDVTLVDLAEYVVEQMAQAFARKEDECLIDGDGTSTYGGIVGLRSAILGKAGGVSAASGHSTLGDIDTTDLRALMGRLPDYPGMTPVWLCSKKARELVFGRLMDAAGGNTAATLAEADSLEYAGFEIVTTPAMPASFSDLSDEAMLIFGDLRLGAIFGDRQTLTLRVDPYSLSSYQQTKVICSERFDLNVSPGVGSATEAGPIVALIGTA